MEICQSDMEQPGWVRSWCQDDQQLPVAAEGYRMTTQTVPPSFSVYCVSFPFVMHADACTRIILAARGFISPYIMRKVSSSVGGPLSFVFPRINVTRVNWPWCSAVIAPLSFLWFVHEIKTHDICTIHGITAGSGHERANTVSVAIRMLHYAHMWIYISASKLPLSLSLSRSLFILICHVCTVCFPWYADEHDAIFLHACVTRVEHPSSVHILPSRRASRLSLRKKTSPLKGGTRVNGGRGARMR